jgi:ABC-type uncharacterized transport system YnjBCD substrate-binding protein
MVSFTGSHVRRAQRSQAQQQASQASSATSSTRSSSSFFHPLYPLRFPSRKKKKSLATANVHVVLPLWRQRRLQLQHNRVHTEPEHASPPLSPPAFPVDIAAGEHDQNDNAFSTATMMDGLTLIDDAQSSDVHFVGTNRSASLKKQHVLYERWNALLPQLAEPLLRSMRAHYSPPPVGTSTCTLPVCRPIRKVVRCVHFNCKQTCHRCGRWLKYADRL